MHRAALPPSPSIFTVWVWVCVCVWVCVYLGGPVPSASPEDLWSAHTHTHRQTHTPVKFHNRSQRCAFAPGLRCGRARLLRGRFPPSFEHLFPDSRCSSCGICREAEAFFFLHPKPPGVVGTPLLPTRYDMTVRERRGWTWGRFHGSSLVGAFNRGFELFLVKVEET